MVATKKSLGLEARGDSSGAEMGPNYKKKSYFTQVAYDTLRSIRAYRLTMGNTASSIASAVGS